MITRALDDLTRTFKAPRKGVDGKKIQPAMLIRNIIYDFVLLPIGRLEKFEERLFYHQVGMLIDRCNTFK